MFTNGGVIQDFVIELNSDLGIAAIRNCINISPTTHYNLVKEAFQYKINGREKD